MIKAGFIGAGFGFVYIMSLTLLSPVCTLCFTPLLGLGVGYIAGWFDKPLRAEASVSRGVVAGVITGLGVVVGQMMATVVNGILVTNSDQLPALISELGLSQAVIANSNEYWQTTLTLNSLCSMFNLALIIGLGALGSIIWFRQHGVGSLSVASS